MARTDILLPTCNRLASLVMTLAEWRRRPHDVRVIVADQSDHPVADDPVVQTLGGVIEVRGGAVEWHHRPPLRGIAEQRDFLLRQATAETVLYLDDDVLMETWVLERLLTILDGERCAFVGAFPAGLSHRHDRRPEQQQIDYWHGPVLPEIVEPESAGGSAGSCTGRRTSITSPSRYRRAHGGATKSPGSRPASFTTAASWRRWGDSPSGPAASLSLRGGGSRPESPHATLGRLRHGPIRDVLFTGADNRLKRPRQRGRPRARPAAGDDRALRHCSRHAADRQPRSGALRVQRVLIRANKFPNQQPVGVNSFR